MSRRSYYDYRDDPWRRDLPVHDDISDFNRRDSDDLRRERADWDRRHFERSMDMTRTNQGGPGEALGSGAEYYDITGRNPNPLLEHHSKHRGKGPKGYSRSDDRIHDEICDRLTQHPLSDATHVEVAVAGGEVTLSGEIHDRRMKHMVEDVTDSVSGVKEIHNKLRIHREDVA